MTLNLKTILTDLRSTSIVEFAMVSNLPKIHSAEFIYGMFVINLRGVRDLVVT